MKNFDEDFREWMKQLGDDTGVGVFEDRHYVAFNHGEEFFYFDQLPDGWIRLTHTIRGGHFQWEIDAATTWNKPVTRLVNSGASS